MQLSFFNAFFSSHKYFVDLCYADNTLYNFALNNWIRVPVRSFVVVGKHDSCFHCVAQQKLQYLLIMHLDSAYLLSLHVSLCIWIHVHFVNTWRLWKVCKAVKLPVSCLYLPSLTFFSVGCRLNLSFSIFVKWIHFTIFLGKNNGFFFWLIRLANCYCIIGLLYCIPGNND